MTASNLILIFDGDCGFCTSAANSVVKRSVPPVTAVPWQLTDVRAFGLSETHVQQRVYLAMGNAETGFRTFGGHRAFTRLLIVQPHRVMRFFGFLIDTVPARWFAALGYALVARFRHRLPGGTPACSMNRG